MARKPVHLIAAGTPTPRERAWAAMRKLRGEFTRYTIARRADMDDEALREYILALKRAGYIEQIGTAAPRGPGKFPEYRYRLVRDTGIQAPRVDKRGNIVTQGNAQQHMWRWMRITRDDWNWHELAEWASTEDVRIAQQSAKQYALMLARAGYLQVTQQAKPGTAARYQLKRAYNTGPRAPMIQRVKRVWDPNLGQIMYAPKPEEVADEC